MKQKSHRIVLTALVFAIAVLTASPSFADDGGDHNLGNLDNGTLYNPDIHHRRPTRAIGGRAGVCSRGCCIRSSSRVEIPGIWVLRCVGLVPVHARIRVAADGLRQMIEAPGADPRAAIPSII